VKFTARSQLASVLLALCVVRSSAAAENDCRALVTAAHQLDAAGDLAGARGRLASCLSPSCSSAVREQCARQQAAVEAKMPIVVLEVRDESSNNVSGVRATMDGAPVPDRAPIFVNPGAHHVVIDAAGFRRTDTNFEAHEPQKRLRVLVFLTAAPVGSVARAPEVPDEPERAGMFATGRQKVALALGVAGVAGLAVGATWALKSKSTYDHAVSTECGGDPNQCSTQGTADGQTAHHQASIATVGFIAGGALLAAGAAIYFTGPKQTGVAIAPAVDPNGGLALVGTW
jgi:hypothetical protein